METTQSMTLTTFGSMLCLRPWLQWSRVVPANLRARCHTKWCHHATHYTAHLMPVCFNLCWQRLCAVNLWWQRSGSVSRRWQVCPLSVPVISIGSTRPHQTLPPTHAQLRVAKVNKINATGIWHPYRLCPEITPRCTCSGRAAILVFLITSSSEGFLFCLFVQARGSVCHVNRV